MILLLLKVIVKEKSRYNGKVYGSQLIFPMMINLPFDIASIFDYHLTNSRKRGLFFMKSHSALAGTHSMNHFVT